MILRGNALIALSLQDLDSVLHWLDSERACGMIMKMEMSLKSEMAIDSILQDWSLGLSYLAFHGAMEMSLRSEMAIHSVLQDWSLGLSYLAFHGAS